MKRAHSISLVLMLLLAACKAEQPASNSALNPAAPANSNQPAESADGNANSSKPVESPAAVKPTGPAQLLGTYESREVHDQGVVTLISQLKTSWLFSADGTYQRLSVVKGKPYHADSGTFRVDPPDNLVLTIQVTGLKGKRKIQNPPLTKTHKFSLFRNGDELRLTSAKGSIGIFERVAKPSIP